MDFLGLIIIFIFYFQDTLSVSIFRYVLGIPVFLLLKLQILHSFFILFMENPPILPPSFPLLFIFPISTFHY